MQGSASGAFRSIHTRIASLVALHCQEKHYVTSEVIHRYKISGGDINYSSNDTLVNQAVAGLMNSHGHKVIMTSQNIKYIGVGVLKEKRRFIVVMVFAYDFSYPNN